MSIATFEKTLQKFGATKNTLSAAESAALDQKGYLVIAPDPGYWAERDINLDIVKHRIDELVAKEGWRGGVEGKENSITPGRELDPGSDRLGNLVEKDAVFRHFMIHPKVLAAVRQIIAAPFKCSAVDMRNPRKGGGEQQIHIDWLPRMESDAFYDCAFAGFFIDGMTVSNGALRVLPGTHRKLGWPNEYIDVLTRHPDEIRVELEPGAIIVANAHVWHAGAENHTGEARRAIYVDYRNRKIPQLLNQKRYLSAATIDALSEEERYLLAVREADPMDGTVSAGPGDAYRKQYGNQYLPTDKNRAPASS